MTDVKRGEALGNSASTGAHLSQDRLERLVMLLLYAMQ